MSREKFLAKVIYLLSKYGENLNNVQFLDRVDAESTSGAFFSTDKYKISVMVIDNPKT